MAQKVYKQYKGSVQDQFQRSRAKIQMMAGGFANGKTTSLVVKALSVARDYPGANMLLARSTYPKLNDTLRREFLAWCPRSWIKAFTKTDNIVELTNGTTINFRYVSQKTGGGESGTSNLLSATYDFIGVDQIEDPEIVEKDFDDLLGRLRGQTSYIGDDPTMPSSGPRFFCITCNPTRNWVYRKLVKPYHEFKRTGRKNKDLIVDTTSGEPIIDVFEGSTYTNIENLPADFVKTLESSYRGQMKDRFLLGNWAAYEGLVYPQYDENIHKVPHDDLLRYMRKLRTLGYRPTIIASYDYGLAVESCFLVGFADDDHNVFVVDGFYEKGASTTIEWQSNQMSEILGRYGISLNNLNILADPSIFRRVAGDKRTVGKSVAQMFDECNVTMIRGNNDILNGIQKVQAYLTPNMYHRHPITGTLPGAYLYFSDKLTWLENEIGDYYWKKDTQDDVTDIPQDKRDHAMDALKYMLSDSPDAAEFTGREDDPPAYLSWGEYDDQQTRKPKPRYA